MARHTPPVRPMSGTRQTERVHHRHPSVSRAYEIDPGGSKPSPAKAPAESDPARRTPRRSPPRRRLEPGVAFILTSTSLADDTFRHDSADLDDEVLTLFLGGDESTAQFVG